MKTQYGDLPIEVDPSTGRAKMVRGGAQARKGNPEGPKPSLTSCRPIRGSKESAAGERPAPSPVGAYDSKLEGSRASYLGYLLLAKDILHIKYHPFTIDVGCGRTYTPDFLVWWADGRIVVEEVKGSLKGKNARDSVTRFHAMAALFPMFICNLVMRPRGQWEEKWIRPTIASRS